VVLLDILQNRFEDGREGLYLLKEINAFTKNVILMTALKVETAVEGLKAGALIIF
jgi:DNA-binding response OmpR family regulator